MRIRLAITVGTVMVLILVMGTGIYFAAKMGVMNNGFIASAQAMGKSKEYPFAPPSIFDAPPGEEGDLIRLGYQQHNKTSIVLPEYDKSTLSCGSCHANGGVNSSLDLVGVAKTYPKYNSRAGKMMTFEDRINGCFMRSMNGEPLPKDGIEIKAFLAYYEYISQNVPDGITERPWAKLQEVKGDITKVDIENGRELYDETCFACHGTDGNGQGNGLALWGENSFNVGAGMNRIKTATAFIKEFMPKVPIGDRGRGSFTEQEAMNIAAYIQSVQRPDFPNKIYDWPNGDAPEDAAYETLANSKEPEKSKQ